MGYTGGQTEPAANWGRVNLDKKIIISIMIPALRRNSSTARKFILSAPYLSSEGEAGIA
jgi:hypothetical protein